MLVVLTPTQSLFFNRTKAHSSHAMASAPALRIHLCVACGCYAGTRSNGLNFPCARFPTKAGKEALAAIAVGKQQNSAAFALYRRLGKEAWSSRYSKGGGLAGKKLLGLQPQRVQSHAPSKSSSGPASSDCSQTRAAENFGSHLCAPPVQEDSSLKANADMIRSTWEWSPAAHFHVDQTMSKGDLEQRGKAAENRASYLCAPSVPEDSLLKAQGDLEQRGNLIHTAAAAVVHMQGRCQPIARPMEGGPWLPLALLGLWPLLGPPTLRPPLLVISIGGRKVGPSAKPVRLASPLPTSAVIIMRRRIFSPL